MHTHVMLRLAALGAVVLAVGACATIRSTVASYDVTPDGMMRTQQQLRDALTRQNFPVVLDWRENDALLRALNIGAGAYYAGQWSRSATVLDSAAMLADDRGTASVSRNGLSLVTNDFARSYQVRRTERLFIPYYAMLAYTRLEQWESAAVEARRLSSLLSQFAGERTREEEETHAVLHYLCGAVFERAGESNAASVAYRNAGTAGSILSVRENPWPDNDAGELIVVIERGFVAHRAADGVNVFIGDDDVCNVAGRSAVLLRQACQRDLRDDPSLWRTIAFPQLRRAPPPIGQPAVVGQGGATTWRATANLDDASTADEGRERASLLTRAAVRTIAKRGVAKAVKDKKGKVAGRIAQLGANVLERADTRSWHVLPQQLTVLRIRAAAGVHAGMVIESEGGEQVALPPTVVRAGELSLTTLRIWRESRPFHFARR